MARCRPATPPRVRRKDPTRQGRRVNNAASRVEIVGEAEDSANAPPALHTCVPYASIAIVILFGWRFDRLRSTAAIRSWY